MFIVKETENYIVKLSNIGRDENYHIFIKGGKEFIVGLWDVVYNDNDVAEENIFDISEFSVQNLQSLDIDSLVYQGYKILF